MRTQQREDETMITIDNWHLVYGNEPYDHVVNMYIEHDCSRALTTWRKVWFYSFMLESRCSSCGKGIPPALVGLFKMLGASGGNR